MVWSGLSLRRRKSKLSDGGANGLCLLRPGEFANKSNLCYSMKHGKIVARKELGRPVGVNWEFRFIEFMPIQN